jgi:hypothetical protein
MPRDILITGETGLYTITGVTEAGLDWMAESVMGQINGVAYREDFGAANGIAYDAAAAGLIVALRTMLPSLNSTVRFNCDYAAA